MSPSDKIKQYTGLVCEQIRWKKTHDIVSEEIENHIVDQADAFIQDGIDEKKATDQAITEMGDPITLGSQFDRTHRPKVEWSMIGLTIFLLLIGLSIGFFIETDLSFPTDFFYFKHSIIVAIIGSICMIIAYFVDFTIIGQYPKIIFTLLNLSMILLIPCTVIVNGLREWLVVPFVGSLHSSVFMTLFSIVYAGIIYTMRRKGYLGIILCGIFYAIPLFIFMLLYDGGTSIFLYTISCLFLLTLSISNGWFHVKKLYGLMMIYIPVGIFSIGLLLVQPDICYSIIKRLEISLNANSPSDYLPSIHLNYMLTYLIYRIGWIAFLVIFLLLVIFITRGFYLCVKQKNVLGKLVTTSILFTFTMQIMIYISTNLGFQLFTQHALPLVSYGNLSMGINLALVGIMLSVFRSGYLLRDHQKITGDLKHRMVEFIDGKIIIDLGVK